MVRGILPTNFNTGGVWGGAAVWPIAKLDKTNNCNAAAYASGKLLSARHILFNAPAGNTPAADSALKKAQSVRSQLTSANFATMATKYNGPNAAGPGGDHPRPAGDVAAGGPRGGYRRGRGRGVLPGQAPVSTREELQVPKAEFRSYYGRPILKEPTWKVPETG